MRIGVFDSGVGGEAVAHDLAIAFANADIITVNDRKHVPYGNRPAEEIIKLTDAAIQPLLLGNNDYIVIACNTATAIAIEWLRATYPSQRFIGLEPMIKPATELTKSGIFAIFATPATLASIRYQNLRKNYLYGKICLEPDCSSWASMIENSTIDEAQIQQTVESILADSADVIVLACTHYHWIRELIEQVVDGRAIIIDPSNAIIQRIKQLEADSLQR